VIKSIDVNEPCPVSPVRAIASPPSSLSTGLPSSQITAASLTSPAGWASPAFLRRKEERFRPAIRPAFTAPADPLPFSTDDILQEELDNQKPRKRTRFGRKSGEWKFTREDDSPDYAQHDLTGTFDVEMIEREIDVSEEREKGSPARGGQGNRRASNYEGRPVPDFGLDGSSASRPRPFVEAEGFERIIRDSVREAPAARERSVAEEANIDEQQGLRRRSQDTFSTAPEQVVPDATHPEESLVQAEGPKLSNGSVDVLDEVKDHGEQTSNASRQEPERLTKSAMNLQDNDHDVENELETRKEDEQNDEDKDEDNHEDEDNNEDENVDDTNGGTTKDGDMIKQGKSPEKPQSPTVADEVQEITIARPRIPAVTATEEVTQASAQLQAELISQLGEPVVVEEDWIRTDDMMETLNEPEHNEEDLQTPIENTPSEPHADTPPGISQIPQVAQTDPDMMDQYDTLDRPIGPLKVPDEVAHVADEVADVADVSFEGDTSSIEQHGFQETVEHAVMPTKEASKSEVPAVVAPQPSSATPTTPDAGVASPYDPGDDASDGPEDGSNLEDNALPIVISDEAPSLSEVLEPEKQPTSDTLMQEQDDVSRSLDDVVESVMEVAATEEVAKAVITMPITEWTLQPSPALEAQGSRKFARLAIDNTGLNMDESGHQEEAIKIEDLAEPQEGSASAAILPPQDNESAILDVTESVVEPDTQEEVMSPTASADSILRHSPALVALGGPEDASFIVDSTGPSMDESSHQEEATKIEGPNEPQEQSTSVAALEPEQDVTDVAENANGAQGVLAGSSPPASTLYLQREDVTVDTTKDIKVKVARLAAMTDDQLLQEGQSLLAELIEENQQETRIPSEDDATPVPISGDTPMVLSDESATQEPPAQRLSAFGVMQSKLNRPVAQGEEAPPLLPGVFEHSEGSSSGEEMQEDEKEPSVVISLMNDSADPEDDEVEYDDVSSVAEAASSYGLKDSEESFTGFDDEERSDVEAATVEQDSSGGYEIEERPDIDLAPNEEEPFAEFEDEEEDEKRSSPGSESPEGVPDKNEAGYELPKEPEDMDTQGKLAPAFVTAERAILDQTTKPRLQSGEEDEVDEEARKDMVDVDSKSKGMDNDIYMDDDEDEELPELDFKLIPTLDKPLVAASRAVNNAVLASSAKDTSLPTLQDEDEGIDTRIADIGTGAHHVRGAHAVDDTSNESVSGRSTHHERIPIEQAEVDLQISKPEPQKRSSNRRSNVPSELKGWFSPRESLQDVYKNDITSFEKEVELSHTERMAKSVRRPSLPSTSNANEQAHAHTSREQQLAEPSSSAPAAGSRQIKHHGLVGEEAIKLVGGLHTSLSYYTPLTDLQVHTNSQHEHDSVVDVLAAVSSFTAKAKRATSGPKDHFTTFHITTPTVRTNFDPVEVQVFRPRKEVLPLADVGDVALLRNFVVRSNNGKSFLLSTAGSAWCVWRYAKKERLDLKNVGEECLGPPVEIGVEERQRAQELSSWFKNEKQNGADA